MPDTIVTTRWVRRLSLTERRRMLQEARHQQVKLKDIPKYCAGATGVTGYGDTAEEAMQDVEDKLQQRRR